jgi:hypothetical protein
MAGLESRLSLLEERCRRQALEQWKQGIRDAPVEDVARFMLAVLPLEWASHTNEERYALHVEMLGVLPEVVEAAAGKNPSPEWTEKWEDEVARALVDERKPALLASMRRLDPERTEEILNRQKVTDSEYPCG